VAGITKANGVADAASRISRRRSYLTVFLPSVVTVLVVVVNDRAHTCSDRYTGDCVARYRTRATADDGANQHAATRKGLKAKQNGKNCQRASHENSFIRGITVGERMAADVPL
jgi:hypothetical protein